MAVYPIGEEINTSDVFMKDILSTRSMVIGPDAERMAFVANVIAAVSNGSKFLGRAVPKGKTLLVLPRLASRNQFSKVLPKGTDRNQVFTSYSAQDLLDIDIKSFELIVLWGTADVFNTVRHDEAKQSIDVPSVLNQAKGLLVYSESNGAIKSKGATGLGAGSTTSSGEASLLGLIDNRVTISADAIDVSGPDGQTKWSTAGEKYEAPRLIVQERGNWLVDPKDIMGLAEVQ